MNNTALNSTNEANTNSATENQETCCPICRNHCPVDALRCGRGRAYFENPQEQGAAQAEGRTHDDHEGSEGRHARGEHSEGSEGRHARGEHGEGSEGRHSHGEHSEGFEGRHSHGELGEGSEGRHSHGEGSEGRHSHGRHDGGHRHGGDGSDRSRDDGHDHGDHERGESHFHSHEPETTLYGLMRQSGHFLFHHSGNEAHGQVRILRILAQTDGISQKELQQQLGIKPGSVSEILSKLEEKGLIERSRSEADARRVDLHLTEKGKEKAGHAENGDTDSLFQALTEDEQEQLRQLLTKLVTSWFKAGAKDRHHGDETDRDEASEE